MISSRELQRIKHEMEGMKFYYAIELDILKELIAVYEKQLPELEKQKEAVKPLPPPARSKTIDD